MEGGTLDDACVYGAADGNDGSYLIQQTGTSEHALVTMHEEAYDVIDA